MTLARLSKSLLRVNSRNPIQQTNKQKSERAQENLWREPTPYEWLLLQVYPSFFFGSDIFADLFDVFLYKNYLFIFLILVQEEWI